MSGPFYEEKLGEQIAFGNGMKMAKQRTDSRPVFSRFDVVSSGFPSDAGDGTSTDVWKRASGDDR